MVGRLNGAEFYRDGFLAACDGPSGFTAKVGDVLSFDFIDTVGGCRGHSELWLHDSKSGCGARILAARQDGCNDFPRDTLFDSASVVVRHIVTVADGSCRAGSISGTIRLGEAPLPGVAVVLEGPDGLSRSSESSRSGEYNFAFLEAGNYTVTPQLSPQLSGNVFSPQTREVTIEDDDVADQDFEAFLRIRAQLIEVEYRTVPGMESLAGDPKDPEATVYGQTLLRFEIVVVDQVGQPQPGVGFHAVSPAVGFPTTAFSSAVPSTVVQYLVDNLGGSVLSQEAAVDPLSFSFQLDEGGPASDPIDVPVVNNYAEVAAFFVARIPPSPTREFCLDPPLLFVPSCALSPGVVNNMRFGANAFACGGYQAAVLNLLDRLRLDTDRLGRQHLLNGLDYGPVQYSFGGHQAVAVYSALLGDALGWLESGQIFDPWPSQEPQIFPVASWLETAPPLSILGVDGSSVYSSYPTNSKPYPTDPVSAPAEFKTYAAFTIHSPIDVLVEDVVGDRIGVDPEGNTLGETPVVTWATFPEEDGTRATFADLLPDNGPYDLLLTATADGTFTLDLAFPGLFPPISYRDVPITLGDQFTLHVEQGRYDEPILQAGLVAARPEPGAMWNQLPELWLVGAGVETTTAEVVLSSTGGLAAALSLQADGLPEGIHVAITPGLVDLAPEGVASAVAVIELDSEAPMGLFPFVLTARQSGAAEPTSVSDPLTLAHDDTPPALPTVLDDGEQTSNLDRLHASWSAEDPETGVAGYDYAVSTDPLDIGAPETIAWTSVNQTITEITLAGLTLEEGRTYFVFVRAHNPLGQVSPIGISDGILAGVALTEGEGEGEGGAGEGEGEGEGGNRSAPRSNDRSRDAARRDLTGAWASMSFLPS